MSLRLKMGQADVQRMSVLLDSTVTSTVKNALVEGDWVYVVSTLASRGVPASAATLDLVVKPVTSTAHRNSYPILYNPLSPEHATPGVGYTVPSGQGYVLFTDRYDSGASASTYDDVGLVAKSLTVGSATVYGLTPKAGNGSEDTLAVGWSVGIVNGELVARIFG